MLIIAHTYVGIHFVFKAATFFENVNVHNNNSKLWNIYFHLSKFFTFYTYLFNYVSQHQLKIFAKSTEHQMQNLVYLRLRNYTE